MIKLGLSCLLMMLCSAILTWMVRIYTLRRNILDIPNERTSHRVPMPRGGGIAIIVTFLIALTGLYVIGYVKTEFFLALIIGGIAIAAIGYYDDAYSIHPQIGRA